MEDQTHSEELILKSHQRVMERGGYQAMATYFHGLMGKNIIEAEAYIEVKRTLNDLQADAKRIIYLN